MWKIKTAIFLIFTLLLLMPSIVRAHEEVGGMVRIVNGYQIRLILPDVVRMGETQFQVVVTGADGLPVSGAILDAAAQPVSQEPAHSHNPAPANTADPMAGMAGMDMPTPAAPVVQSMDGHAGKTVKLSAAPHQTGLYQGAISFSKDGAWSLTIHLMIGSEMLNAEFPLEVAYATPAAYAIIAAFLILNVVIIASAAALRIKAEQ